MESSPNLLSERIPPEVDGFTRMKSHVLVVCRSRTRFRTTRTTPGQSDHHNLIPGRKKQHTFVRNKEQHALPVQDTESLKCELTGKPRCLPVREHGGEPGEAVPVAVKDGVLGCLLAAKLKTGELDYWNVSEEAKTGQAFR